MKSIEERVRDLLRQAFVAQRDAAQDGYHNVKDGKFLERHVFQVRLSAKEADLIAEFVGVVPDGIQVLGDCAECVFGDARGGDLGWSRPCSNCSRPKMTHFVPLAEVAARSLAITATEARLLQNAYEHVWWAAGLVPPRDSGEHPQYHESWQPHLDACHLAEETLKAREMLVDGMHGRRITNKGMSALKAHKKSRAA